jgi:methylated-DNA-[protein]-cysteine S-methyltransferase
MQFAYFDTPAGTLFAAKGERGLTRVSFKCSGVAHEPGWICVPSAFADLETQLAEYFAGARRAFELPLNPAGTAFQRRVWDAVSAIPYGQRRSYGDVARAIGEPSAARAVGAANARNPLAIIIPCHRLVGADGAMTGYIGGIETKCLLLEIEECNRFKRQNDARGTS